MNPSRSWLKLDLNSRRGHRELRQRGVEHLQQAADEHEGGGGRDVS